MKNLFLTVMATFALALAGCGKQDTNHQTTVPSAPAVLEPWQIERDKLQAAIKTGMTQDEVTKVAGEPKRVRSTFGSMPVILWQYELPGNRWFNVRFGKDERVVSAELDTPAKIQR